MLVQVAPPPVVSTPPFDRRGVNIIALIAHGSAADLARLNEEAGKQGFIARHVEGPWGDELMILFSSINQATAWPFVLRTESGRYPRLKFERALLPPARSAR